MWETESQGRNSVLGCQARQDWSRVPKDQRCALGKLTGNSENLQERGSRSGRERAMGHLPGWRASVSPLFASVFPWFLILNPTIRLSSFSFCWCTSFLKMCSWQSCSSPTPGDEAWVQLCPVEHYSPRTETLHPWGPPAPSAVTPLKWGLCHWATELKILCHFD